jgi:hypothetical protein
VRVLADLSLPVRVVVEVRDRLTKLWTSDKRGTSEGGGGMSGHRTFHTGGRRILQTGLGHLEGRGPFRGVGDGTDLRSALSEVGPLVALGVAEPVRHRAIGAVDHTGAPGVDDPRHGLFILQMDLRRRAKESDRWAYRVDRFGDLAPLLVPGGITEDLERAWAVQVDLGKIRGRRSRGLSPCGPRNPSRALCFQ